MTPTSTISDVREGRVSRRPNAKILCERCGAARSLYARPARPLPRFCSVRCRNLATVAKRKPVQRPQEEHPSWIGGAVSTRGGRSRARRKFAPRPCEVCGATRVDRHHKDGDTANNSQANIAFLCRRHHMEADGRLEKAREQMRAIQPLGVEARWTR